MELTDIMPLKDWEQFEKELFDRFGINCTVYSVLGMAIIGKPNWCNHLCPEIKANKTSLAAICAPGNQYFMNQAKQTQETVISECDAGFIKITVPIFFDGEFLGTAGGCGLLPEGGKVEDFISQKTLGLSQVEILERCKGMGTMSKDRAQEMATFIERQITLFVSSYDEKYSAVAS